MPAECHRLSRVKHILRKYDHLYNICKEVGSWALGASVIPNTLNHPSGKYTLQRLASAAKAICLNEKCSLQCAFDALFPETTLPPNSFYIASYPFS